MAAGVADERGRRAGNVTTGIDRGVIRLCGVEFSPN